MDAGHEVIGVDVVEGSHTKCVGSIVDRDFVSGLFEQRPHGVIHTATLHKPDIARHSCQRFVEVNVTGTLNLLEASVENDIERFVFTSTTSLMISREIRRESGDRAIWLDRDFVPLAPRNIYGVTKLAAENLCRMKHLQDELPCVILRTSRFFPEEDDNSHRNALPGENLKAVEFLHRRLAADDAARAHLVALEQAPAVGFGVYIVSAPPPFAREDALELKRDARKVIARYYPDAPELFAARGWQLPHTLGRVYDPSHAEAELGFRCQTDFGVVLEKMRSGRALPFAHDPSWFTGTPSDVF